MNVPVVARAQPGDPAALKPRKKLITKAPERSFLNGILRQREKLAPRCKVGAYANIGFSSVCA
jgi:hypothetical protein